MRAPRPLHLLLLRILGGPFSATRSSHPPLRCTAVSAPSHRTPALRSSPPYSRWHRAQGDEVKDTERERDACARQFAVGDGHVASGFTGRQWESLGTWPGAGEEVGGAEAGAHIRKPRKKVRARQRRCRGGGGMGGGFGCPLEGRMERGSGRACVMPMRTRGGRESKGGGPRARGR